MMPNFRPRSYVGLAACLLGVVGPAVAQETATYEYDPVGRLVVAKHIGAGNNCVASYNYDRAGNRTQASVAINGSAAGRCRSVADGTDFNGDGIDDILWRSTQGYVANWLATPLGGFGNNDSASLSLVAVEWKIVGVGDFNRDGRSDLLWWNTSNRQLTNWLGTQGGGFVSNAGNFYISVGPGYRVVGVADFNGDGFADILWRADDGTVTNWLGQANGTFQPNDANSSRPAGNDWTISGTGDFNGDGRADIIWRRSNGELGEWLGQANGGFATNGPLVGGVVDTSWKITAVGDFNGDGYCDLLWRNDSGDLSNWLGRPDGSFVDNSTAAYYSIPSEWVVAAAKDYNGDGRSDILWRNTNSGVLSDWLGQPSGAFVNNDANASNSAPTDWFIQGPRTF